MQHRKAVVAFAVTVAVALSLTACAPDGSGSSAGSNNKPVIGISVKTITNDPFQSAWVEAAQAKITDLGGTAEVLTAGGQTAVANQVSQINDLIAKQVDGLIINPIDGAAVVPALTAAKEAGIPVVIVDSPVASGNEDLYETFIATDNVKAGQDLATYLVQNIGVDSPKVAVIEGAPGSLAGDDRKKGFLAGLKTGGVEPVASASGEWSNDKSLIAMENILTAHPDLDAVLSASDVMVDGILQALASANKTNVKVLAIDGSKVGVQNVIDGKLLADNTQDPGAIGTLAATNIIGLAKGTIKSGSLDKYIDSGTTTVTSNNAAEALKKAF
jgi:ribose transport system substrate-binding protein